MVRLDQLLGRAIGTRQVVLAGSMRRAMSRVNAPSWAGSILSATWIPFFIVMVLSAIFGAVAMNYCPGAVRLRDVMAMCVTL